MAMQRTPRACEVLLIASAALFGCGTGGVNPVTGGTPGILHSGSDALSEIQITIHQMEGGTANAVGFAVTGSDGSFELVTNGAQGPLILNPGEYCCTLESVGAPVVIPADYAAPGSTPLKVAWSGTDERLDLNIPMPAMLR